MTENNHDHSEHEPITDPVQTVQQVANQVSAEAAKAISEARHAMRESATIAKEKASDSLLSAADAIRNEAIKHENEELQHQAQTLARGMEKTALYLDSRTLDQMSSDATEVVKQNIWQTLGVVFLLGLLLGLVFGGGRDD
jgi:ElaB/YqjD/DUF883 family membrane-anchored ribosome-binding protein